MNLQSIEIKTQGRMLMLNWPRRPRQCFWKFLLHKLTSENTFQIHFKKKKKGGKFMPEEQRGSWTDRIQIPDVLVPQPCLTPYSPIDCG